MLKLLALLTSDIGRLTPFLASLEASLQEKTAQGRAEAEDIRTQIAPLLEAHAERRAAEQAALGELDLLRQSVADALGEVSQRLRSPLRRI